LKNNNRAKKYIMVEEGKFKYLESNGGKHTIVLLHGLLGQLSNFQGIVDTYSDQYNIVFPHFEKVSLIGNSLGGHLAQLYTLDNPDKVVTMTLTGSSGLFENAMGSTFPKRGNYDYIKEKVETTFYDPKIAPKELIDEIFKTVNDRMKAIRIVATAKSAGGKQDGVTPPFVGEKFNDLLVNSELHFIDKCGHAPMMEHPEEFNKILGQFLAKNLTE